MVQGQLVELFISILCYGPPPKRTCSQRVKQIFFIYSVCQFSFQESFILDNKMLFIIYAIKVGRILKKNNARKNMCNLVVWIWQYQVSETNKYRESRRQKKTKNIFILALPKTKSPSGQMQILSFFHVDYLILSFLLYIFFQLNH